MSCKISSLNHGSFACLSNLAISYVSWFIISLFFSADKSFVAYQYKENPKNGTTFLALVSPAQFVDTKVKCNHVLGTMSITPEQNAEYYFGFGWSKWGFDTFEQWIQYVSKFDAQI